jgi:rod shape-determining protein MreC
MPTRGSHRSRLLLVSLLVTSLLFITLDLRGVSVVTSIRGITQTLLAPLQRLGSDLLSPVGNLFSDLRNLGETRDRITSLEEENKELRTRVILNKSLKSELGQLKGVLDLAGAARYKVISARVISKGDTAGFSETIVIDQGSRSGIKRDMTVIAAAGLVGVVKSTTENSSVVLLLNDPSFRIGVRIAESQDMGILSGEGGDRYSLQMLSASGKVVVGDLVFSRGSSGDKPFVPGVPIGRVTLIENTTGQLTKRARVAGFVELNSLRVVSVVLKRFGGDPGDALIPRAPTPAPTVTVTVTPTPAPSE